MPQLQSTSQPVSPRVRIKDSQQQHDIKNSTKSKQPALSSPTRLLQNSKRTVKQKKGFTLNPHKQSEEQQTKNKQWQNHLL